MLLFKMIHETGRIIARYELGCLLQNTFELWDLFQTVILLIVSAASLIGGLATNIQNPANQDIEQKLHASPSEISWSLSLFILVQGSFPLVWAAVSEIKGRKVSANVFK
jgi:MFS family permease